MCPNPPGGQGSCLTSMDSTPDAGIYARRNQSQSNNAKELHTPSLVWSAQVCTSAKLGGASSTVLVNSTVSPHLIHVNRLSVLFSHSLMKVAV